MLKLTNSLKPAAGPQATQKPAGETVTIYSCGPTVYDQVHIGNLRSFIMDDLLRRSIVASGYKLKAIMNITDVDDKTIKRSQEKYPELAKTDPQAALKKTTDEYTEAFFTDLERVGVDRSLFTVVRATDPEQIVAMQKLILEIIANGFAYVADGSVYFDLKTYRATHPYGLLANVDFGHQQARIDNDEYDKAEAQDFVLWKAEKAGEPAWDFQIGADNLPGRPGWHIECSAMSAALGTPFDIHTGGIDLRFPHHENELAQTMAATGQPMAHAFLHWNHLFVDGKKMSKSLNNFYTLSDIAAKDFSPTAFRLLTIQAHYSSELNFTWESLTAAQNTLRNFYGWTDGHFQDLGENKTTTSVVAEIDNDLAFPAAWAKTLADTTIAFKPDQDYISYLDQIYGLGLASRTDITSEQKSLIINRTQAKASKDYQSADAARTELLTDHIELDDTAAGPRWRRTSI